MADKTYVKRTPPRDRSMLWIELRRAVREDDLEITVQNGDTYDLTLEETRLYLIQLGIPELRREKALDRVWSMYAVRVSLQDGGEYRLENLEPPRYPETNGPRPFELDQWVFGRTHRI